MPYGNWLSRAELAALLGGDDGPVAGNYVHEWARQNGVARKVVGTLFDADAAHEALLARKRTNLLRAAGWAMPDNAIVRHDEFDRECPICGGFAVSKPYAAEDTASEAWLSDEWPWVCEQGHKSDE